MKNKNCPKIFEEVKPAQLRRFFIICGFIPQAENIYAHSLLPPYELAAWMIDIDHFKNINDRYEHQARDAVLQELAARIRDNLRPTDLVARYGGEEFVALLARISPRHSEADYQAKAAGSNCAVVFNPADSDE